MTARSTTLARPEWFTPNFAATFSGVGLLVVAVLNLVPAGRSLANDVVGPLALTIAPFAFAAFLVSAAFAAWTPALSPAGVEVARRASMALGIAGRALTVAVALFAVIDPSGHSIPRHVVGSILAPFGGVIGSAFGAVVTVIALAGAAIFLFALVALGLVAFTVAMVLAGDHNPQGKKKDFADFGAKVGDKSKVLGKGVARSQSRRILRGLRRATPVVVKSGVIVAVMTYRVVVLPIGVWVQDGTFPFIDTAARQDAIDAKPNSIMARLATLLNRDSVTDDGQPIYVDRKTGQVAAAWKERVLDADGKPSRATVLRSTTFAPRINDIANRRLAEIAEALVRSIITDALEHGNAGGGRTATMFADHAGEETEPTPTVPIGTRAYIKVAMVRGMGPGDAIPVGGAKLGYILDVHPSVTNNILKRITRENLAENMALRTNYSPAQISDRLVVHDEDLQDDPAFGDIPGIYVSFRLGGMARAAVPEVEDEDGLPW